MDIVQLSKRLEKQLLVIYSSDDAYPLLRKLIELAETCQAECDHQRSDKPRWSEEDILLITYADSIKSPNDTPLASLQKFSDRYFTEIFSIIHILPFFPSSSDDGFAIYDFENVNPEFGSWDDIQKLTYNFHLAFDLVLNHISREHIWFVNYLHNKSPGKDYLIEVDPETDLSAVTRPRSTPLLTPVRSEERFHHLWSTFSVDQIDVNYANPDVLFEFIKIFINHLRHSAKVIRLDAVAYIWKEIGTSCIHLPQAHAIVKIIRAIFDFLVPSAIILSETNVPHQENISYFGQGDEAHLIYQFSLPPLLLHAIHTGNSRYLTNWASHLEKEIHPKGCTFLNFTASHDGIGLRPLEGILSDKEIEKLIEDMRQRGGFVSTRSTADGDNKPYELNISYFDAFKTKNWKTNSWHINRFLLSQTIPLSLQGIPAFYINSLMATPNDYYGVEQTEMTRSINRYKWDQQELEELIAQPLTDTAQVFSELSRRIQIRKTLPAFHPEAPQITFDIPQSFFAVKRTSIDGKQTIYAIHNLIKKSAYLDLSYLNIKSELLHDHLHNEAVEIEEGKIHLRPYHTIWAEIT
jgi:sucrose phosphorylase